jgi:integrase
VSRSTDGRYWLGKYRDVDGGQKTKLLGKVREMTKSEAKEKLTMLMRPVNAAVEGVGQTVNTFLEETFFPLFTRKWKQSTLVSNQDRIEREIGGALGGRLVASLTRDELQSFLDARSNLSYSTVSHLRWDLKKMFDLALSEGFVTKNPAVTLFVPKGCKRTTRRVMTLQDVQRAIVVLELRERLVFKLATVAGLRPGEIFGLKRRMVMDNVIDIRQRVYRGQTDTPKTNRSVRSVAVAPTVKDDLEMWMKAPRGKSDSWLFPSERLTTPMSKDNFMFRHLRPALKTIGLEWVDYQVMRRTHASLMRELGVDPKIVADMMGHDVNVNLNVYTQTSLEARLEAAETLGSALVN